jgi:hypothetical protein
VHKVDPLARQVGKSSEILGRREKSVLIADCGPLSVKTRLRGSPPRVGDFMLAQFRR